MRGYLLVLVFVYRKCGRNFPKGVFTSMRGGLFAEVRAHITAPTRHLLLNMFLCLWQGRGWKKQSWEQGSSSNRAIPDPPAPPPHPIMPNRIDRAATTADNKIEQTWEIGKHKFSDVLFMTSSSFFLQMCEKQAVGHIDSQALSVCTLKCHVLLDLAYIVYFLTGLYNLLNLCVPIVPCMYRV